MFTGFSLKGWWCGAHLISSTADCVQLGGGGVTVLCWDTVFVYYTSAYMGSQKPETTCPFVLEKTTPSRTPRGLNVTQRCENRQETHISTPIGHSGSNDLWGHRANIRHVLPLFFLFPHRLLPRTLSEGQGLLSLSPASQQAVQPGFSSSHLLFPSNSSWKRVAASSSISPRKPPRNTSYIIP